MNFTTVPVNRRDHLGRGEVVDVLVNLDLVEKISVDSYDVKTGEEQVRIKFTSGDSLIALVSLDRIRDTILFKEPGL